MYNISRHIRQALCAVALTAGAAAISGCSSAIDDDLPPCPTGAELRFVYNYNMEFANAFPSQVDCLTLLVYDANGSLVTTRTELTDVLADEDYRMIVELPVGKYHFVAYGGMACDKSSFHFVNSIAEGSSLSNLSLRMHPEYIGANPGVELHPLFYGNLDFTVPENSITYTAATVYMMKDTNNLRIMLQNIEGQPISPDDFTWEITDDNTLFDGDNNVVPTESGLTYNPWTTGLGQAGSQGDTNIEVAFAEFSTSRLTANSSSRLVIKRAKDGEVVISIPLVNYLLLLKSQHFASMSSQEFLDRESRWNMIFFLQHGSWLDTRIVINDWIVRLNSADL